MIRFGAISAAIFVVFSAIQVCAQNDAHWPRQYKIAPWDLESLTEADVVGPDGIVYPNWTLAGVQGGIPQIADWPRFDITEYGGTDDEKVDAALAAAVEAGHGIIYFPQGTYTLKSEHEIRHDSIVFAGAGKNSTVLEIAEGGSGSYLFNFVGDGTKAYSNPPRTIERGALRIATDKVDHYQEGDWIRLCATSAEPGDVMYERYSRPEIGLNHDNAALFGRTYFGKIIGIDQADKILVMDRPTHHDFYGDEDPQIRKIQFRSWCGVQDLTLKTKSGDVAVEPVQMKMVFNCWIKNVAFEKTKDWPFALTATFHIEVRGCDFNGTWADIGRGSKGYLGVSGWYGGDYNLMDDCTGRDLRHMAIFQWSNSSVVRNSTFTGKTAQSVQLHGRHPHDNLVELCNFDCEASIPWSYSTDKNKTLTHGTEGPRNVFYNNVSTAGMVHLSYVENHIIAYNTLSRKTEHTAPGIWAHNKAWDAIIRGNSIVVSESEPFVELCDITSLGWEIYDNDIYGSNGYAWEGDGSVVVNDNNRILPGEQKNAAAPEAPSIYQWQLENAHRKRLLLLISKGAIHENGDSVRARLIRVHPKDNNFNNSLSVDLSSTNDDLLSYPSSVVIPGGINYVEFSITAIDNHAEEGEKRVAITAVGEGYLLDSDDILVLDDEMSSTVFAGDKPNRFAVGPGSNWASADFGAVGVKGSGVCDDGVFTITGSGKGIYTYRSFSSTGRQFCYTTVKGNGEIKARLDSLTGNFDTRSVGLMAIDDENALGDAYMVTASKGVYQYHRTHDYWPTEELQPEPDNTAPIWLRIKREGPVFSAYYAAGATNPSEGDWILLHSLDFYQDIPGNCKADCAFDSIMYFGMFVSSNDPAKTATATFSNVEVTSEYPVAANFSHIRRSPAKKERVLHVRRRNAHATERTVYDVRGRCIPAQVLGRAALPSFGIFLMKD